LSVQSEKEARLLAETGFKTPIRIDATNVSHKSLAAVLRAVCGKRPSKAQRAAPLNGAGRINDS
jgi:hypothetical protein